MLKAAAGLAMRSQQVVAPAAAVGAAAAAAGCHANPQAAAAAAATVAARFSTSAVLQQQQHGDGPPGLAFLQGLIDYEKIGVPKAAGVAAVSAAAAAAANAASSSGSSKQQEGSSSSASFDLTTMRQLLAAMGSPQQQLSVVHIAGTKGKGSVAALISAVLRAAGYRVGTYTSPHLFDIRERIVVGGQGAPDLKPTDAAGNNSSNSSSSRSGVQAAAGSTSASASAAAVLVSAEDFEALAVRAADAVATMQQQQQQTSQAAAPAAPDSSSSTTTNSSSSDTVAESSSSSTTTSSSSSSSSSKTPSHFEVVTAMALQHFVDQSVDIAVIETGLGGSTDATNVFGPQQLQLAVLTAVGMDHVEALGGSLESIAAAKAGIMKAGVPVVVGPQQQQQQQEEEGNADSGSRSNSSSGTDVVMKVLKGVAGRADMACPLVTADDVVQVKAADANDGSSSSSGNDHAAAAGVSSSSSSSSRVVVLPGPGDHLARQVTSVTAADITAITRLIHHDDGDAAATPYSSNSSSNNTRLVLPSVQLQLVGQHQAGNVQTAVAAALVLAARGWQGITAEALQQGLEAAWLPGRFQVAQLPGSHTHYVLDGAHTADSAAALADTLRAAFPTEPVVLVVAMAADKQHREVLQALRSIKPRVAVFTSVPIAGSHARSAPPGTLAAHWQAAAMLSTGKPFRCRELIQAGLGAALDKARHELGAYEGKGVVVVTGSLHAVAAGLKLLQLA